MKSFNLQWHITHRCNLRCSHCYQDDYSAFGQRETLAQTLRQYDGFLKEYDFRGFLTVTGGEPLLHPDLFWLLGSARELGIKTAVLTNGTLLDLYTARRLSRLGVDYVQVSLDGTRDVHDSIRGRGSFDAAVNGIRALTAFGIYTDVSFTVQRANLGELKPLARLCRRLGVDKLWFDRVILPAAEDRNGLVPSGAEYAALCREAAALNRRGRISCARALQFIPCARQEVYRCSAGDSLLALLADGSVMPCRRLPIKVGDIRSGSLSEIYRDSPVLRELRSQPVPGECRGCRYAEACHGGARCAAFAKTGRFDAKDPDCEALLVN